MICHGRDAGSGAIVVQPDGYSLFNDELEIASAREHWRIVTTELKDRQLRAAANGHSIQRLVCAYLIFDRMYREVAEHGVVVKTPARQTDGHRANQPALQGHAVRLDRMPLRWMRN